MKTHTISERRLSPLTPSMGARISSHTKRGLLLPRGGPEQSPSANARTARSSYRCPSRRHPKPEGSRRSHSLFQYPSVAMALPHPSYRHTFAYSMFDPLVYQRHTLFSNNHCRPQSSNSFPVCFTCKHRHPQQNTSAIKKSIIISLTVTGAGQLLTF